MRTFQTGATMLLLTVPLVSGVARGQSSADDSATGGEYLRRLGMWGTAPMDSLGGVSVGSRFNRAGYACESSQVCIGPARMAGQDGALKVTLCNGLVHEVSFDVVIMDTAWVQRFGANAQDLPVGARQSISVGTDTTHAYDQLSSTLFAAGWLCGIGEPTTSYAGPLTRVDHTDVCVSSDGRQRYFGVSVSKVAPIDTAYGPTLPGMFTALTISTRPRTICTEGL